MISLARSPAPRPSRHGGGPGHVPHPAHRVTGRPAAARRAQRPVGGALRAPPPQPARRPVRRAHRHRAAAGLGRRLRPPRGQAGALARRTVADGGTTVRYRRDMPCDDPDCGLRQAVVAPLTVEGRVIGTLQAFSWTASAGLVRATEEVARWVSGQLELAELDASRTRLMEAEVRALRAQISPHFVYNSLTAIASFVRTDPERARELLLEFAEFTRLLVPPARRVHHPGRGAELDRALPRPGEGPVRRPARGDPADRARRCCRSPSRCCRSSRWWRTPCATAWSASPAPGAITIIAEDADQEAVISVEDDGVGEDPERVRRALAGDATMDSVGLGNVDERLRTTYGDEYGLVVETAPGAGTKVTVRVPKFAPRECRAMSPGCGRAPSPDRACGCWSSTTSGRPSTSWRSCSARTSGWARCSSATRPPRRCGCCRPTRSTPSSSTSRCPG